jgi:F-type H+-transporting ATPase subunit alpha
VVEVLKQGQYAPVPVAQQIISIYAVTNGHMDKVPVEKVRDFEAGLRLFVEERYGDLLDQIDQTGNLGDEDRLKAAISEFASGFNREE